MKKKFHLTNAFSLLRYRKYVLGENINLVARCEHDGVLVGSNGETQFINIKTLNEWDPKVN